MNARGLCQRYLLTGGLAGLVAAVVTYRLRMPEADLWPVSGLTALAAAVLVAVTGSLLWGAGKHAGQRFEEAVWVNMKRAAFSLGLATLISQGLVFSTGAAQVRAVYVAVIVFALGNLVAAHFMYQGLICWSRAMTVGADPSDLLNGISAVLVVMGIGNLAFPAHSNLVDILQRQASLGAAGVAVVLLSSTLAVASIANLFGDRRTWLVSLACVMTWGPISACMFDPLRGGVAAQGMALLAMSLLVLAAGMPRRPQAPVSVDRKATSVGALIVVGCALVMLMVLGFSHGSHGLSTMYCAVAAVGVSARLFGMVRDLEQLQISRALALTDDLTGIANRRALLADLQTALGQEQPCTLMLLDLDEFKLINDRYGHTVGDELLRQIAAIFAAQLPRRARLARLGGDEFAVLLTHLPDAAAMTLGARLMEASTPHRVVSGRRLRVRASVGITTYSGTGGAVDAEEMLRRADTAMYRAKTSGSGVAVYDPALDALAQADLRLIEDLRETLEVGGDQIVVHYQPQVAIDDGRTVGVEALVRWQHPELGLLAPARFIDLAERNGLMSELTTQVVMNAARQSITWRKAGLRLSVSVNLSSSCLSQPGLIDLLDRVLAMGVDPMNFVLEITETTVMIDPQLALGTMEILRSRGFNISIDDFGTGYSSLSYLDTLPATELKIDKSFIDRILDDDRTASIVAGTIDIAHRLGIRLVAEGVEDGATLSLLSRIGCDIAQGYVHGRPMPVHELETWMRSRPSVPVVDAVIA